MRTLRNFLFPLSCIGLISCGGGGESGDVNPIANGDQPYGEVVFENQGNKLTATAWFFDGHSADHAANTQPARLWQNNEEHCDKAQHEDSSFSAQLGQRWRTAYSAGNTVSVDSQTGNYATLNAQNFGSTVSYATDERWIREPMPADAMLSVSGSDRYPGVPAIPVTPLPLLNSVTPDTRTVTNASGTIAWENNASTSSTIRLNFSTTSGAADGMNWVICTAVDDGLFQVPAEVFNQLEANAIEVNFSISRVSETTVNVDDAILKIKQREHPL